VESFTEVESGLNSERPALAKALAAARVRQVPIVVAKVDRLTRSVGFLSMLLDAGVDVRFADLPQTEGTAGRFMLKQMALVAELEAALSLIVPRLRSPPPNAVARSWVVFVLARSSP
jgi:DNA invertase Pin-like site-specific DNA recombinase